jgi:hypothetical protein
MSHSKDNRHVHTPGPKDHSVSDHCRRLGISPDEERKLRKLLGSHAPLHEIHANYTSKQPKFR